MELLKRLDESKLFQNTCQTIVSKKSLKLVLKVAFYDIRGIGVRDLSKMGFLFSLPQQKYKINNIYLLRIIKTLKFYLSLQLDRNIIKYPPIERGSFLAEVEVEIFS